MTPTHKACSGGCRSKTHHQPFRGCKRWGAAPHQRTQRVQAQGHPSLSPTPGSHHPQWPTPPKEQTPANTRSPKPWGFQKGPSQDWRSAFSGKQGPGEAALRSPCLCGRPMSPAEPTALASRSSSCWQGPLSRAKFISQLAGHLDDPARHTDRCCWARDQQSQSQDPKGPAKC